MMLTQERPHAVKLRASQVRIESEADMELGVAYDLREHLQTPFLHC
jgi:hypothetical protein